MEDYADVRRDAAAIRRRVLQHTVRHDGGYLSQACSSAELLATLLGRVLRLGPTAAPLLPGPFTGVPGAGSAAGAGALYLGAPGPQYDRFIFSPAHYAVVLYAALIGAGRLDERALDQFNQDGGTMEMIGAEHSPGFTVTSGSLSQALSVAGGIALARRLRRETGRVCVFMSDGEFQEGQTWEAVAAMSHHGIDGVVAVVDVNGQQCDGRTGDVMGIEPLADRITAFGGVAADVDGHDPAAVVAAFQQPHAGRPLFVLGRTDGARGIPALKDAPLPHYVRFGPALAREALVDALQEVST